MPQASFIKSGGPKAQCSRLDIPRIASDLGVGLGTISRTISGNRPADGLSKTLKTNGPGHHGNQATWICTSFNRQAGPPWRLARSPGVEDPRDGHCSGIRNRRTNRGGGESAKNLNRPGMERLLALVNGGKVQTVIIAKLDRLTRSVKDLAELLERFQRRGVSLVSVAESLDTGSAAGRLVINIMTAVSQWEREAIGERTRDAMSNKRSNGERVGNIAYGFVRLGANGQHLEPDPQEQAVLIAIRDLRAKCYTLRGIAAELNDRGLRTRRASAWRLEHIARIVRRPTARAEV